MPRLDRREPRNEGQEVERAVVTVEKGVCGLAEPVARPATLRDARPLTLTSQPPPRDVDPLPPKRPDY